MYPTHPVTTYPRKNIHIYLFLWREIKDSVDLCSKNRKKDSKKLKVKEVCFLFVTWAVCPPYTSTWIVIKFWKLKFFFLCKEVLNCGLTFRVRLICILFINHLLLEIFFGELKKLFKKLTNFSFFYKKFFKIVY